jgi:hypothetical protein
MYAVGQSCYYRSQLLFSIKKSGTDKRMLCALGRGIESLFWLGFPPPGGSGFDLTTFPAIVYSYFVAK